MVSATLADEVRIDTLNAGQRAAMTELGDRISALFARREPHEQALRYMAGLLAGQRRVNSWQMAELAGDESPWRMQRLLNRARWDTDRLRDVVVGYLTGHLGQSRGVLVLGEIGIVKKGTHSVAVARQYSETSGRLENCQIGLVASYVSAWGSAVVDRELYLPSSWVDDPDRCERARVPAGRVRPVGKPELARGMVNRLARLGLPFRWVIGGVNYGRDAALRDRIERSRLSYAFAVPATHRVATAFIEDITAGELAAAIPAVGWQRRAGAGPDSFWARVNLVSPSNGSTIRATRALLVRRSDRRAPQFHLVHAQDDASTAAMIDAIEAGGTGRATIAGLTERTGLDRYEVRSWPAWYRHVTLALGAMAIDLVGEQIDEPRWPASLVAS